MNPTMDNMTYRNIAGKVQTYKVQLTDLPTKNCIFPSNLKLHNTCIFACVFAHREMPTRNQTHWCQPFAYLIMQSPV